MGHVTAEIAQWVPLSLGGSAVECKGASQLSWPLGKPLGAFLIAVILGMRDKGVVQKIEQLGSNEQLQEGNWSLLASKMHS